MWRATFKLKGTDPFKVSCDYEMESRLDNDFTLTWKMLMYSVVDYLITCLQEQKISHRNSTRAQFLYGDFSKWMSVIYALQWLIHSALPKAPSKNRLMILIISASALARHLLRRLERELAMILEKFLRNSHRKNIKKRLNCCCQSDLFEVHPVADYAPNPSKTCKTILVNWSVCVRHSFECVVLALSDNYLNLITLQDVDDSFAVICLAQARVFCCLWCCVAANAAASQGRRSLSVIVPTRSSSFHLCCHFLSFAFSSIPSSAALRAMLR